MTQPTSPATPGFPSTQTILTPAKALQKIVNQRLSGRLIVQDPGDRSVAWCIYLGQGQVHYANSTSGQPERLAYLAQRYYPALVLDGLSEFASDYLFLCSHWQSGQISLQQIRKLLYLLTQEALIQILALPQAPIQFERTVGLDPLLLSMPLQQVVLPVRSRVQQWAQIRPQISSPLQRPRIAAPEAFLQWLQSKPESVAWGQELHQALNQQQCLYEIATKVRLDVEELALRLQPLIHSGVIKITPFQTLAQDPRPIIACIDDSKTVQRNVQSILEASGYRVLALLEPVSALTTLVRHKPSLVLLDINMPEIDGYELCRMLRQSEVFRDVPVIMLTGRDGLIDRIRARMVGATDYLTKPFSAQDLISLTQKLIDRSQLEIG